MFQYAIALTGGIATGKSTVANLFKLHGFLTIDADKITHFLLDAHMHQIEKLFGKEYIKDKKVDRKKLGGLVFNNKYEKTKLENFLHPLIKEKIIKEAELFEANQKPYLIDIPLFFETKSYDIDKVIIVYATKKLQIERLMKRDNISKEDALVKIENQLDIEEKKKLGNYIISNTKNISYLVEEVERVKNDLLQV